MGGLRDGQCLPTYNLGISRQTIADTLGHTEVLPHMQHGSNPRPQEGNAWDVWVGGMELGGNALGGIWDGRQQDGWERGSRPKRKRKRVCHSGTTGFEFQHGFEVQHEQQGPNLGPIHSWWCNSEEADQRLTRDTPHLEFRMDGFREPTEWETVGRQCLLGSSSGGRDRAEGQSGGM